MINIIELSEQVYQYLNDTELTYSYRKSNYQGRLDQGFWFYGNENYLAVSFWSGMDWKNRTPNIVFIITSSGTVYLEINVSDSDLKRQFVIEFILPYIDLGSDGRRFRKYYADNCSIDEAIYELQNFIEGDKITIDEIIKKSSKSFFHESEDSFTIISKKEFRERQDKILKYRQRFLNDLAFDDKSGIKPNRIESFEVFDFGPISHLKIEEISESNQWIFITGENGSGKTSLLRAIATTLGYRVLAKKESTKNPNFKTITNLFFEDGESENFIRVLNQDVRNRRPKVAGLCMYGPFRLINSNKLSQDDFEDLYTKSGAFSSLFSDNSPLLDIDRQIDIWKKDKISKKLLEKRQYFIKYILTSIVPRLYDIDFKLNEDKSRIVYKIRKNDSDDESSVYWEDLSSGTKSVLFLLVDILLRLYDQQPKVTDPSEFQGIVIIDEIDLHLHPHAQKNLVVNLSNVFRNVQFIATTHSPIPILGAPSNTMIFVMQNDDGHINIERMDDKVMFRKILPNAIFSSPIFGFDDLLPISKEGDSIPYLEDDYKEINQLESMNNRIKEFLNNDKQRELFNLFNSSKK